jgi:hypothetical protein
MSEISNISNNLDLIVSIKSIVLQSGKKVGYHVNREIIQTSWNIGKEISDNEKRNKVDKRSSIQIILVLYKQLTSELGKGFLRSNLFNIKKIHETYSSFQTLSGQLSWSHSCKLLSIEDEHKRSFYEKEPENSSLSIRELKRQISSSFADTN